MSFTEFLLFNHCKNWGEKTPPADVYAAESKNPAAFPQVATLLPVLLTPGWVQAACTPPSITVKTQTGQMCRRLLMVTCTSTSQGRFKTGNLAAVSPIPEYAAGRSLVVPVDKSDAHSVKKRLCQISRAAYPSN